MSYSGKGSSTIPSSIDNNVADEDVRSAHHLSTRRIAD